MNWTSGGRATVVDGQIAHSLGNEMAPNNVNLGFDVGFLECVTLRFHNSGGNVNVIFNGDVGNFPDFQDAKLGGGTVSVAYDAGSTNEGTLRLAGEFKEFSFQEKWLISFAIGGQELFIDDICPCGKEEQKQ